MAQSSPIAVKTETTRIGSFDPLALYESLVEVWGAQRVAILESVSGPAHAARVSRVLFQPLLTVALEGSTLAFAGDDVVVSAVLENARNSGFVVGKASIELKERSDLWNVLRCVRDSFVNPHEERTDDFRFGFFGYFGYDVAWAIEELPTHIERSGALPDLMLSVYAGDATVEVATGKAELHLHSAPGHFDGPDGDVVASALVAEPTRESSEASEPSAIEWTVEKDEYLRRVETAQEHIAAGDIYQVQLGHEIRISSDSRPLDVYKRLRNNNPSPYMFLGTFLDTSVIGASPEICVRVEGEHVTVRPIAGTTRRGATTEEDAELVAQMLSDEKEIAEHVMLVDLARNDVGRVSVPKSLGVDELMTIEQYSHVSHIVSNVVGRLRDDFDTFDAIASTFPAGTVTGAPKIRAMEIIESLESNERGMYAGAVGLVDFGGYSITCLSLRSTSYRDGVYRLRASGGVVADSKPESEWRETLIKMGAPFLAVTGKEIFDARTGS